jgi:hypothetical protein
MMLRHLSALAVAAALTLAGAGCTTAAGNSAAARPVAPPVRTQDELAASLLRVEDLPSGYTEQPGPTDLPPDRTESAEGGQGGGVEPCGEIFDQLRGGEPALNAIAAGTAEIEFSRGDDGPFLLQGLLSSGNRAGLRAALDTFRQLPALCSEFTENDEQGSFTIRLTEVPFAPLGDEVVAVRLDATGTGVNADVVLGGYLVLIRTGATMCLLTHFGIPGVELAETETVARAAVARLD